ncbi:flavoprotein [Ignicoccus hospitalis]|nr:flavoprotein [Ignicoccus hospitalis]
MLWAVTGAGHWMRESAEVFEKLAKRAQVTVIFSKAGYEVAKLYGVLKKFEVATGGYYRELEVDPKPLSHVYGRVMRRAYDAVVVAPMTANTAAKFVLGIADNLVTTALAMARKAGVEILALPTDAPWVKSTTLPCVINDCVGCEACPPQASCPTGAIVGDRVRRILLERCVGCEACVGKCPFGAISCFSEAPFEVHELELEILKKLEKWARVLKSPRELAAALGVR